MLSVGHTDVLNQVPLGLPGPDRGLWGGWLWAQRLWPPLSSLCWSPAQNHSLTRATGPHHQPFVGSAPSRPPEGRVLAIRILRAESLAHWPDCSVMRG